MSTTSEIDRLKRNTARKQTERGVATRSLARPVIRGCRARAEDATLAAEEDAIADDPTLAADSAALAGHRFCALLFYGALAVLVAGELVFVMPALMNAIGAVTGGFLAGDAGRFIAGVAFLAALTSAIVILKRSLPPLSTNLRDAIAVEVTNPQDTLEVEAAFQRRSSARWKTALSLAAITVYLLVIGWVMGHNLSAGRLFLDRLDALAQAEAATPVAQSAGDLLFGATSTPASASAPPPQVATKSKNPQSAILGIFLILHAAILIIPIDWKRAGELRQSLASRGITFSPAAIRRRRARCARKMAKSAGRIQQVIVTRGRDEQIRRYLQATVRELVTDFELSLASGRPRLADDGAGDGPSLSGALREDHRAPL